MRAYLRFLSVSAAALLFTATWASPRQLTFEERVAAQVAIERVYYSHQTGASRPFEEAVPRSLLEAKVRDYLGKSAALEHSSGAITSQKLQQEQARIESRSHAPDRLEEIYAALGNDPVLIQECFVRAVLVDRLSQTLPTPSQNLEDTSGLDVEADAPVPGCTIDSWQSMSTVNAPGLSRPPGVWTGNVLMVWGMDASGNALGGRYNPLTDSWSPISTLGAPEPRTRHSAVWTGRYMIIWGGAGASSLNSGGRYDPIADSWMPTSLVSAPSVRVDHTAIWSGNVMIVWGGAAGSAMDTGSRYNPESDIWSATTQLSAPSPRFRHTAIWTGSRMIVWGGDSNAAPLGTGGQYDPVADHWTPTTETGRPTSRTFHTAVWSGSEMIVWGGFNDFSSVYLNTGGRYNPLADTWTPTSTALAATARASHVAVWDGIRMIVWGGSPNVLSRGGRYDPATDTWSNVTMDNQPLSPQRSDAVAAWTGQQMLVWGGGASLTSGGRYFGDTATLDLDQDGSTACEGDCNDADATVHPNASETCNGVDDDCDGIVDQGTLAECDDQDPCTIEYCNTNGCAHTPAANGTGCADGDACTQDDTCQDGACEGGNPLVCSALDECHDAGTCDPSSGICSNPPAPDGTPCSLSNCTNPSCHAGVCGIGTPTLPPSLSVALTPTFLQPTNHKLINIVATVEARDACGTLLPFVLTSITSSEPDDSPGPTDGATVNDIQGAAFGTSDTAFQLRAERDRTGTGRTYTVRYATTDSAGQFTSAEATVRVELKHVKAATPKPAGEGPGRGKPTPKD